VTRDDLHATCMLLRCARYAACVYGPALFGILWKVSCANAIKHGAALADADPRSLDMLEPLSVHHNCIMPWLTTSGTTSSKTALVTSTTQRWCGAASLLVNEMLCKYPSRIHQPVPDRWPNVAMCLRSMFKSGTSSRAGRTSRCPESQPSSNTTLS
jgi:hypothetical protein